MIGKSIYIWQISACFGGDPVKIADALALAGFQSAILHNAYLSSWRTTARIELIKALKTVGIMPIGGAAVYGAAPVLEATMAAEICNQLELPAFVFDAESRFDAAPTQDQAATRLLQTFREKAPSVQAGWCWWPFYRSPRSGREWHPKTVLQAAMPLADFGVPMAYWNWGDTSDAAVRYLDETWKQWREVTDKPIYPAGRAYLGDGGTARPGAIREFEHRARQLGTPGVTWWSLQHALNQTILPGVWPALAELQPFDTEYPTPAEPLPEPGVKATVLASGLRVRSGPGIEYPERIKLALGSVIQVRETKPIEVWVRHDTGWSAQYNDGEKYLQVETQ